MGGGRVCGLAHRYSGLALTRTAATGTLRASFPMPRRGTRTTSSSPAPVGGTCTTPSRPPRRGTRSSRTRSSRPRRGPRSTRRSSFAGALTAQVQRPGIAPSGHTSFMEQVPPLRVAGCRRRAARLCRSARKSLPSLPLNLQPCAGLAAALGAALWQGPMVWLTRGPPCGLLLRPPCGCLVALQRPKPFPAQGFARTHRYKQS